MALKKEKGTNKAKGLCKLAIDEDMTIYAIDILKTEMSKMMDVYENFELNLSGVEEIDSAGIQLLLAFNRELTRKKQKLTLTSISKDVSDLLENYGVSDRFNIGELA